MVATGSDFVGYSDERAFFGIIPILIYPNYRSALVKFFEVRHALHERLLIKRIWSIEKVRWGWGFGIRFNKQADDIEGSINQVAKAGVGPTCDRMLYLNAGRS
jgi:hypothetical protein